MELAQALGGSRPVFALDDGVVSSGSEFLFSSIEAAAAECLAALRSGNLGQQVAILGGWSYGGVVAVEMMKQMVALAKEDCPLDVQQLVLFDAPLRPPVLGPPAQGGLSSNLDESENNGIESYQAALGGLNAHVHHHFERCTDLLRDYQRRVEDRGFINCRVLDIRPSESRYLCSKEAAEEVVVESGLVHRLQVQGSHWTMIFGDHAVAVAAAVQAETQLLPTS